MHHSFNLLANRQWINQELLLELEEDGFEIVSMLKGLINSIEIKIKG